MPRQRPPWLASPFMSFSSPRSACGSFPCSFLVSLDVGEGRWHKRGTLVGPRGVGVAELFGQHRYQLDQKGRIALPKRYLEALAAGAYVTLGQDGCLWVFPQEEFDRQSERIRSMPLSNPQARA